MPHDLQGVLAHVTAANRPNTHGAILAREIERLRRDCGELYQVIGALAYASEQFDDQQITKALDNAVAAAQGDPRPHDDLLPFTTPRPPVQATPDAADASAGPSASPDARCACGAMPERDCGEMPGRHCGAWDHDAQGDN